MPGRPKFATLPARTCAAICKGSRVPDYQPCQTGVRSFGSGGKLPGSTRLSPGP